MTRAEPAPQPRDPVATLIEMLDGGAIPVSPEHECPYLPGRRAREQAFSIETLDPEVYHGLMDAGMRRSGHVVYRPVCEDCKQCVPLRVPVDAFRPSRSQRRAVKRNRDVTVDLATPVLDDERHTLYQQYLNAQHPGSPQGLEIADLEDFLYRSPVATLEAAYRVGGRLIGVSILDVCRRSASSVYHYFDPAEAKRSLGVFSVVREIGLCRQWGVPHYYMGYWVQGAQTMDYKANYKPHEVLIDGEWVRRERGDG